MKNMEKMLPEEERKMVSQRGRSTAQRGSIGHPATVYTQAKNGIPMSKNKALLELQAFNGSTKAEVLSRIILIFTIPA